MAKEVVMPKLGITMKEGTISRWLVGEGKRVEKGAPLLEVISDKASIEIEALESGILARILKQEGETAAVSEIIAIIAENENEYNIKKR